MTTTQARIQAGTTELPPAPAGTYPLPIRATSDGCIAVQVHPPGQPAPRRHIDGVDLDHMPEVRWCVQYTTHGFSTALRKAHGWRITTSYNVGEYLTDDEVSGPEWFELHAHQQA